MDSPGYIMLSRLGAQLRSTQVLANNLANADTPGFRAEVRVGASPDGPFRPASAARTVAPTTPIPLREPSRARYLLLWITQLGPQPSDGGAVHVAELRAFR